MDGLRRLVGARGEPFRLDVERGKVYEFARATHNDDPSCWAVDAPVAPPTFLTTQFHWATDPQSDVAARLDLDWARCLHATQEYEFVGPLRAGTTLQGQSRIADVYEKQGRSGVLTFAVIVTDFTDESGAVVAVGRSTVVQVGEGETS